MYVYIYIYMYMYMYMYGVLNNGSGWGSEDLVQS